MRILASYNIKGGVGKTAAAVNLAYLAAADGRRVLLWDLDPQGAATAYRELWQELAEHLTRERSTDGRRNRT